MARRTQPATATDTGHLLDDLRIFAREIVANIGSEGGSSGHSVTWRGLTFRWEVAGRGSYTVGDEMIVWRWNGTDWIVAWVTYDVFTEPASVLITPGAEDFALTDDGFEEPTGVIVVPFEAAPGTYRVAETISFDTSEGRSEREAGQSFFTVAG